MDILTPLQGNFQKGKRKGYFAQVTTMTSMESETVAEKEVIYGGTMKLPDLSEEHSRFPLQRGH